MILQVTPTIDTTNMVTLLASLLVVLMVVIGFLYKQNANLTKEHKDDLRLFDADKAKSSKELLDVLNKFYLSMEQGKMSDDETKQKLQRIIDLLEKKMYNNG